jgi:hypothetical protein
LEGKVETKANRRLGCVLIVTFLGMLSTGAGVAKGARSPYPQPCSVTFLDRGVTYNAIPPTTTGDRIYSDNVSQQYVDGALPGGDQSVSCQVGSTTSGANGDYVKLLLSAPTKHNPVQRWFWGDYTSPVIPGAPTGTFTDGAYLILDNIAYMRVGTSQAADAHFRFNGNWFLNWCGASQGACANYPGSNAVWVTHSSSRSWDVTTDATSDPSVGDIAQLQDGITNSNFYHVPFKLSIDCPGCP